MLPWLVATAFLHSVIIQEKRGMFKVWNMILIVLSFCLMILGTFVTRTGVISSVHSFARSSLGVPFLGFTAVVLVGSVALIASRWNLLKSDNKLDSLLSREAMFLLNNFVFMTLTFTVFVGTYYSMFSELLTGEKLTVGPPVYNMLIGPQVAVLILLMGIGPLVAWHKSSHRSAGQDDLEACRVCRRRDGAAVRHRRQHDLRRDRLWAGDVLRWRHADRVLARHAGTAQTLG